MNIKKTFMNLQYSEADPRFSQVTLFPRQPCPCGRAFPGALRKATGAPAGVAHIRELHPKSGRQCSLARVGPAIGAQLGPMERREA